MNLNDNQVDIDDNSKATKAEWFTIRELIGLPGMPTSAQGCHKTLAKATENHPEKKRKISGSKAFEFHYTALPSETQVYLFSGQHGQPETAEKESGSSLINQWIDIFNRMTNSEREQVIGYIFRHGFGSIIALTASQEVDKVAEVLNSLPAADRKEILERYAKVERSGSTNPQGPLVGKKAG